MSATTMPPPHMDVRARRRNLPYEACSTLTARSPLPRPFAACSTSEALLPCDPAPRRERLITGACLVRQPWPHRRFTRAPRSLLALDCIREALLMPHSSLQNLGRESRWEVMTAFQSISFPACCPAAPRVTSQASAHHRANAPLVAARWLKLCEVTISAASNFRVVLETHRQVVLDITSPSPLTAAGPTDPSHLRHPATPIKLCWVTDGLWT